MSLPAHPTLDLPRRLFGEHEALIMCATGLLRAIRRGESPGTVETHCRIVESAIETCETPVGLPGQRRKRRR